MNKNFFNSRFWFVVTIITMAAFMRLIPHWPNFTPIAAMALVGGTIMSRKYLAFVLPLSALFLSDLMLGFHTSMWAVYLSFAATVGIGILISRKPNVLNIATASVGSTILFFLVTNFASWLGNPMYAQNMTGLMQCYAAGLAFINNGSLGISFFLNSILGDLFYNALFFGAFYLVKMRVPSLVKA